MHNDYIGPLHVPAIPANLDTKEALKVLIPTGFSDIVHVSIDINAIVLEFLHAEDRIAEIRIPQKIYSPINSLIQFPDFCLQISEFFADKVDYLSDDSPDNIYVLNQNQLLWLALHHRLTQFKKQVKHFAYLVSQDINNISDYGRQNNYSSINAMRKGMSLMSILSVWERHTTIPNAFNWKNNRPVGDWITVPDLDKKVLANLHRDLPIQPSSESMASESATFVISPYDKGFYRCNGYSNYQGFDEALLAQQIIEHDESVSKGITPDTEPDGKYSYIKTIFPIKPNIPARFKSHVCADGYRFAHPSSPIFYEDIVNTKAVRETGEAPVTDGTTVDAVIVFDEIHTVTGRLLCGEVEASKKFASQVVHKDEVIRRTFTEVHVEEGCTYKGDHIVIGTDEDDKDYCLRGFKSVEIISIEEQGINSSYKIVARGIRHVGSGRIKSHCGLKGVTKPKPSLGKIYVDLPDGTQKTMNVDLVTGMNAVKGGSNTILLAQAAMAFRFNLCGDKQYLSSMNEDDINWASSMIQEVEWIDENGNKKMALAGIVQVSVNELAYQFNNVKDQSFMPESGRYLANGDMPELFNSIWDHGVDPEIKLAVDEFQRILNDDIGYYADREDIPVYDPKGLLASKFFDITDIVKERRPMFPHQSKLLDENYNSKGFYLDLRYRKELVQDGKPISYTGYQIDEMIADGHPYVDGPMVRFPSARSINLLVEKLANGDTIYPIMLTNISKCIEACIDNSNGRPNIGFLTDRTGQGRRFLTTQYMNSVRDVMHRDKNLTASLLKPKLPGVGMKQMTDSYVPQGTAVIMDNRTYKMLSEEAGYLGEQLPEYFNALPIRNPVVWKMQMQASKVWNLDQFKIHLAMNHGVILKEYLIIKYCKELLLINPEDAIRQQSDVDGDLMPIFTPIGLRAQELLTKFRFNENFRCVDGVVPEEIQWIREYRKGEETANEKLTTEGGYKLYSLPFNHSINNGPTFSEFFIDSVVAKKDVGLATFNNWAIQNLVEIFKWACRRGDVIDPRDPKGERLINITDHEVNMICYIYSRLVQDLVIRGIKHNAGGSDGFMPFLLDNMIKPAYSKIVYRYLKMEMGIPNDVIKKMFIMISWGESNGMIKSIMQFMSLHNSGKIPAMPNRENFDIIVEHTFYGKLVAPLYEISRELDSVKETDFSYTGPVGHAVEESHNNFVSEVPSGSFDDAYDQYMSELDYSNIA